MGDDLFRKLVLGTSLKKTTINHHKADAKSHKCHQATKSGHERLDVLDSTAKVNVYRKKYKIRVKGGDVPVPIRKFSQLTLSTPSSSTSASTSSQSVDVKLLKTLKKLGIKRPTPVQKQTIPIILSGRDAIVAAPTGTGKTLSFLLPMFSLLKKSVDESGVQVLIVTPTRELADQICEEAKKLSKATSIQYLNKALLNDWRMAKEPVEWPQVLVCTPLRLIQATEDKVLSLKNVKLLVLDEVDRLLDKNFLEQMDKLLGYLENGQSIQKIVFSATIPTGVEDLAKMLMVDPIRVSVGRSVSKTSSQIDQSLVYVGRESAKLLSIKQIISSGITPPMIVFCNNIGKCVRLYNSLKRMGIPMDTIHSEKSQEERQQIIDAFRHEKIWILITTELLSRGLDFPNVANVINYDYPESTASYIHRIGRTGRAGRRGKAVTFYTDSDLPNIRIAVNVMKESGCVIPEWLQKQALNGNKK